MMLTRRTALKRRRPLVRRTRLRSRRATPRRSGRVRDPQYLAWVAGLACSAYVHGGCRGRVHAHHAGPRGLGQKCSDRESIPLCGSHHRAWHDGGEPFRSWSPEVRRSWAVLAISAAQAAALNAGTLEPTS